MEQRQSPKPRSSWRLVAFAVVLLIVVLQAWRIDHEAGALMAVMSAILLLVLTCVAAPASPDRFVASSALRDRIVFELARTLPDREVTNLQRGVLQEVDTAYGRGLLSITWGAGDEVTLHVAGGDLSPGVRQGIGTVTTDDGAIEIARRLLTSRPPESIHAGDGLVWIGQQGVPLEDLAAVVDALFRDAFAATAAVHYARSHTDAPTGSD